MTTTSYDDTTYSPPKTRAAVLLRDTLLCSQNKTFFLPPTILCAFLFWLLTISYNPFVDMKKQRADGRTRGVSIGLTTLIAQGKTGPRHDLFFFLVGLR
jgi:hypothetical protein